MRRLLCLLVALNATLAWGQDKPTSPPAAPKTTAELRAQIEKVLKSTHTPGVGVAIVRRNGPEWIAGIGLADVEAKKPVTPDTLFRIGSVSKSFISLSALKLQQEGKLNLQDTLRSRAPDLEFTNPWEATDPVRIVNLLEHTAGWDDLALKEYAYNPAMESSLREGMAYNPKSRTSRWKPGTRMSYSNSGPAAVAYAIEKVTGQRFEDYVEENWFKPLGMDTASYFDTPKVQSRLTKLYRADGTTPVPYWHIIMRPVGAINASAREMANYVQFFLNRGSIGGVQLLPPEAIDRMEEPTTTYAARDGLKAGYGLGNYATVKRRIFHGHNGGVEGGLTELSYLPDQGVGYVFMINSGSGAALTQIDGLLRTYINLTLPAPPPLPVVVPPSPVVKEYEGWYEPNSPRQEYNRGLARILGLARLRAIPSGLRLGPIIGHSRDYVPVSERLFRLPNDGAPTVALISDMSDGTQIEVSMATFRRIPGWMPWVEVPATAAALLLMASSCIFALAWVPAKLFGHLRGAESLSVRAMPVLATVSLVCTLLFIIGSASDSINLLGRATFWSVGICLSTLAFGVFSVLGLALALRFRNRKIRRLVWWHAFAASLVLTVVAIYLGYWGFIGWRTWA